MENFLQILTLLLLASHLIYGLYFLHRFVVHPIPKNPSIKRSDSIDVLVSVKNEEHHIVNFLKCLDLPEYKHLTIHIADDYSTDNTYYKVKQYQASHIKIYVSKNTLKPGKKQSIQGLIAQSRNPLIVLTDVDCMPAHVTWLDYMSTSLQKADAVIGHGPFFKNNGFLNKLQRWDNAWIAMNYFSFALRKMPYMGVGRNMAIKRDVYHEVIPEVKGQDLISGDDDLLIQALKAKNVAIQIHPDSFMFSMPEKSYTSWVRQKARHVSTSMHYRFTHKMALAFSGIISVFLLPLLIFQCIVFTSVISLELLCIYLIFAFLMKGISLKKLNESGLILYLPILEIVYSFHLIILAIFTLFRKPNQWK